MRIRIRILKKEFDIPWEYLVAFILILIAAAIVLTYRINDARKEVVPIGFPTAPPPDMDPSEVGRTDEAQDYYDVPDADDKEYDGAQDASQGPLMVNINNAGMDELIALPYIGEVKARAIIEYRIANGPFKSVEDLLNVKGIGPKTLERLRPYVTLE
jgi:comEA protein